MTRRSMELCEAYNCKAKVYPKLAGGMRNVGSPDLVILFTNTMSHKMLRSVLCATKGSGTRIARCHTSSIAALKNILSEHTERTLCHA